MNVLEAITSNRAIRRFTDEPVTDDEILTCIRAAVQAPSGGNIQPWQFLVVKDPEVKAAVGDLYRRAYERYEPAMLAAPPPFRTEEDARRHARMLAASRHLAENFGRAPVLVAVLMPRISMTLNDAQGPLDVGPTYASVYPAVQNLMLAARGLGIGSVLTTVFRIHHDEVREVCGIPDRYEIVAIVPLGRPAGKFGKAYRRPADSVTHWNRFGNKRTGT